MQILGKRSDISPSERITGTAVLPTLHGCFSLGTVIGGAAGMAATAAAVPVSWHLTVVALIATGILVHSMRAVPAGIGMSTAPSKPVPRNDTASAPARERKLTP